MLPHVLRLGLGVALLLALVPCVPAQRGDQGDNNQESFRTPQTTPEFWNSLQYEIDVGRYDLAASYLRGLLARNPSAKELIDLENQVGRDAFLRLRNIPK